MGSKSSAKSQSSTGSSRGISSSTPGSMAALLRAPALRSAPPPSPGGGGRLTGQRWGRPAATHARWEAARGAGCSRESCGNVRGLNGATGPGPGPGPARGARCLCGGERVLGVSATRSASWERCLYKHPRASRLLSVLAPLIRVRWYCALR